MSFGKISSQAVVARTVPCRLHQLVGEPVLHVLPLGEANAEFWSDSIARANTKRAQRVQKGFRHVDDGPEITAEGIREARAENRETVARFCVRGFDGITHDDGTPATADDIPAIVRSLPDDVFDHLLAFVSNPENFRAGPPMGDPEAIAGK